MKVNEKKVVMELNMHEIGLICDALHRYYKSMKDEKDAQIYAKQSGLRGDYRDLRNSFSGLVGRSYMGEDA